LPKIVQIFCSALSLCLSIIIYGRCSEIFQSDVKFFLLVVEQGLIDVRRPLHCPNITKFPTIPNKKATILFVYVVFFIILGNTFLFLLEMSRPRWQ